MKGVNRNRGIDYEEFVTERIVGKLLSMNCVCNMNWNVESSWVLLHIVEESLWWWCELVRMKIVEPLTEKAFGLKQKKSNWQLVLTHSVWTLVKPHLTEWFLSTILYLIWQLPSCSRHNSQDDNNALRSQPTQHLSQKPSHIHTRKWCKSLMNWIHLRSHFHLGCAKCHHLEKEFILNTAQESS